jgi:mono/diheme cytochrome c family protein
MMAGLLLAGCGGDDGGGSADTAATTEQTATQETTATEGGAAQASAEGKRLFTQNCAGCHTLADANASGQRAPNLDELQAPKETVERQVTNGGGGMPAFKNRLSAQQIETIATYVSSVAGN